MSQVFSQRQDPNPVPIPIVKFSHNTSPITARTFTWTHVSHRNDLDFVVQNACILDGLYERVSIIMKVTAGTEVLEMHDLEDLAEISRRFARSVGGEAPVEVVVKSPFLAMRYPKDNTMIRRVQIKFRNGDDFQKVVDMLKDLGLPIANKSATPSSAAQLNVIKSSSNISHSNGPAAIVSTPIQKEAPEPSRSMSSTDFARPYSANPSLLSGRSSSTISRATLAPSPFNTDSQTSYRHLSGLPIVPASSPLRKEIFPQFLPQPEPVDPEATRPTQIARSASTASFGPSLTPSGAWLNRDQQISEQKKETTSIYLAQLQKESQNQSMQFYESQAAEHNNAERRSASALSQIRSEHVSRPHTASPHFASHHFAPMDLGPPNVDPFSGSSMSLAVRNDIYDELIPPKRELPFRKPLPVSKTSSLSGEDVPPLPKPVAGAKQSPVNSAETTNESKTSTPIPANTITPKPAQKKRVAQRKAPAQKTNADEASNDKPTVNTSDVVSKEVTMQADEPSPLAVKSASVAGRPASVPPGLVSKVVAPPKKRATPVPRPSSASKRPKMNDQSTQTEPLIRNDDLSLMRVRSRYEVPDLITNTPSAASPPDSYFNAIESFVIKHKDRPLPAKAVELWETPGYADLGEEQRVELINSFIAQRLEDPKFLMLCQDVEHAYQRIGLL